MTTDKPKDYRYNSQDLVDNVKDTEQSSDFIDSADVTSATGRVLGLTLGAVDYEKDEKLEKVFKIIISQDYEKVIEEVERLDGSLHQDIANRLIDDERPYTVAGLLVSGKLHNLDSNTANRLIDAGYGEEVGRHLEEFHNLDSNTANRLIDNGQAIYIAKNPDKFQGLDYNDIANRLFATGQTDMVHAILFNSQGLDYNDIANRLIDAGEGESAERWLGKSNKIDSTIANRLADFKKDNFTAEHYLRKNTIDSTIANRLIDKGQCGIIARYLTGIHNDVNELDINVAYRLIEEGQGRYVAKIPNKFQGIDYNDIANRLIDAGLSWAIARNITKYKNLDSNTANRLIDAGFSWAIARNPHILEDLDEATLKNLKLTSRRDKYGASSYYEYKSTLRGQKPR